MGREERSVGRGGWWTVGAVAVGLAVAGAAVVVAWWALGSGTRSPGVDAELSLEETLGGGETAGYARAERPREFVFPADHGAHPDFRNEWWYVTGNVESAAGRRFGYQVTFFRSALAPPDTAPDPDDPAGDGERSRWRTRQAWMAHFTLTDAGEGRFHAFERFEREALGLAGATTEPAFRVWVGDWEMTGRSDGGATGPAGVFPMTVRASVDSVAVDLTLEPTRGLVLQGEDGLSRKGAEPGDASYYYSFPRLRTTGRVTTPSGAVETTGWSWLDREWSTSVLPEGVVGWDWLALQLDDEREVMVYRLRRSDGSASPWSAGVVVEAEEDGEPRVSRLTRADFSLEPLGGWQSPRDGAEYPVRWRLRVPGHALDLEVVAVLEGQELDLAFRYWEGAVDARPWGGVGGRLAGRGYLELTGYVGAGPPAR